MEEEVKDKELEVQTEGEDLKKEEPKVVGFRERVISRGKKLYPEEVVDDDLDDEKYGNLVNRLLDDADKNDERLKTLSEGNKKLFDIFTNDPDVFSVFDMLKDGVPLPVALRRVYKDEDYLTMDENDEHYKRYKSEVDARKKAEEELAANMEHSNAERADFYKEANMSEEEIRSFEEAEDALYKSMAEGKLDKRYFKRIRDALTKDSDVENSYEQGKVDGRNQKITNSLRKNVGDGLPSSQGALGKMKSEETPQEHPAVSLFKNIADKSKQSKWNN